MSVICKSTSELKTVLETDGVPSAQEVVDVVPPSVPLAPLEEIGEEDGEKLTENERAVLELGVEGGEEDEGTFRVSDTKKTSLTSPSLQPMFVLPPPSAPARTMICWWLPRNSTTPSPPRPIPRPLPHHPPSVLVRYPCQ